MDQLGRAFFHKENLDKVIKAVVDHCRQTFSISIDSSNTTFVRDYVDLAKSVLSSNESYLVGFRSPQQLQELNRLVFNQLVAHIKRRLDELPPSQKPPAQQQQQQQIPQQIPQQLQQPVSPFGQQPFANPQLNAQLNAQMGGQMGGQAGFPQYQQQQQLQQQQNPFFAQQQQQPAIQDVPGNPFASIAGQSNDNNGGLMGQGQNGGLMGQGQNGNPMGTSSGSSLLLDDGLPGGSNGGGPNGIIPPQNPPKPKIERERIEIIIDPSHPRANKNVGDAQCIYPIALQGVKSLRLKSIGISEPVDYTIHEENNVFAYSMGEQDSPEFIQKEIRIPVGTYTVSRLLDVIQEMTLSAPFGLLYHRPEGLLYIFIRDKVKINRFELRFHEPNSIGPILGFEKKLYHGALDYLAEVPPRLHLDSRYVTLTIPEANFKKTLHYRDYREGPSSFYRVHPIRDLAKEFPSPTFLPQLTVQFHHASERLCNFRGAPWHLVLEATLERLLV